MSAQPTRSLWASVQMLVSTFVANAPTIYGDLRIIQKKKIEPLLRRQSRPELWPCSGSGSDIESTTRDMLAIPEQVHTNSSFGSSRKEWFGHQENLP